MAVEITPRAEAQLASIFAYGAKRWGYETAERYGRMLAMTFERIAARDIVWRKVNPALGITGYRCRSGSHYIYWRAMDAAIVILAVLHERMDQGSHLVDVDLD